MKRISHYAIFTAIVSVFSFNNANAECIYEDNLKGKEHEVGVMLNWATLAETNNSMFIVERSEDGGREFFQIGTVKGSGTITVRKAYMFLDPASSRVSKVIYRLKQVDADGSSSLSDPLVINRKVQNLLSVMQMSSETTSKMFTFSLDAVFTGDVVIIVRNASQQVVETRQMCVKEGINTITIDLTDKPEGTYRVAVQRGNEEERMVVRKTTEEEERRVNMASSKKVNGKN